MKKHNHPCCHGAYILGWKPTIKIINKGKRRSVWEGGWWGAFGGGWCNLISGKQERPQEKVGFDHRAEGAMWVSEQVLQTEGTAIVKALKAGVGGRLKESLRSSGGIHGTAVE